MSKQKSDKMYIAGWEEFVKTDARGRTIQQRLDRERADRLAVRDSLLNDDEYQERDFGSRLMNTMGFANGGARLVLTFKRRVGILVACVPRVNGVHE